MANEHSTDDVISFLQHASERGMMPAATAQALMVASRNVFSVLNEAERSDVRMLDLDDTIKRFSNKRARDFNPASLKEYGRRVRRAVQLFLQWRDDPASFSIKTRATASAKLKTRSKSEKDDSQLRPTSESDVELPVPTLSVGFTGSGYQTSFPVRASQIITISNVPPDLSANEADRLAAFIRMLAVG